MNLESQLSDNVKSIKRLAFLGEIFFFFSFLSCLSIGLKYYIDFVIGIFFFILFIIIYFKSYKHYLSDYLPIFIQVQTLKNEDIIRNQEDIPS